MTHAKSCPCKTCKSAKPPLWWIDFTAEQQISSTGQKTFTLSTVDLWTFTSTDRLRVDYKIRNNAMGSQSITIATDDVDSSIITPFITRQFSIS